MGSQEPSAHIAPPYNATDGQDAVRILCAGGTVLDPWQSDILDDWMGRTVSGKWSAPTAGGSVPRQNGKSLLEQGRAASGMLMFNETVIYTAHLQKTATETSEELRAFFEGPKMRRYVSEIRTALGREQIILKSGAKIKFLARTRNGGRGQHGDLLIFDEAQELDETAQGSFIPAISASLNPQTIYVGTPPGPDAVGTVFRALRKRALDGEAKKAAWFEFSVPEIGDVKDPARWAAANPALGRRIQYGTIEGESEQLDADTFARERLGWWSPVAAEHLDGPITIEVPVLDNNFNYWYVGVGVKYNISSLFKNNRKLKAARLNVRKAQETYELAQEQTNHAVQESYVNFLTSFTDLRTQQKSVELADQNYSVTSNRYQNDLALLTDMLDASNMKLSADLGLVNARINVIYNYYKMKYH